MKMRILFLYLIGVINILMGVVSFFEPIFGVGNTFNGFLSVTQIIVGVGFIYVAADPERFLKPRI